MPGAIIVPTGAHHPMAWGAIVVEVIVGITGLIVLTALVLWIRYAIKYRIGR
jgi:hypothetical protein